MGNIEVLVVVIVTSETMSFSISKIFNLRMVQNTKIQ